MRFLVAMITAVVFALIATVYLSSPIASWLVDKFTFDNPDQVADLHSAVFMGVNLAAMLVGWVVGWLIGGGLSRERPTTPDS